MFTRKTVFIVGAGASSEAGRKGIGFPLGRELAVQISKLLWLDVDDWGHPQPHSSNGDFFRKIRQHFGNNGDILNNHLPIARLIGEGVQLAGSIDEFIDTFKDDEREEKVTLLGKAAIGHLILKAERASRIFVDPNRRNGFDFGALNDTWYPRFGEMLTRSVPASATAKLFENVSIVCFNYDRCIEEYLSHFLAARYGLELKGARELVEGLPIYRPYGSLGNLPSPNRPNGIAFGRDADRISIASYVDQLKTFTEQVDEKDVLPSIRSTVSKAEVLVFLGFNFQNTPNIEILRPSGKPKWMRVYSTAIGVSDDDVQAVQNTLMSMWRRSIPGSAPPQIKNNLTCAKLFDNFKLSLAA